MVRKKILLVEDEELNRDLVTQLLEDEYDVVFAYDGEEAVSKVLDERPNLVLMDLRLPVLDGIRATVRIKGADGARHIPIIALTAYAMVGDEAKAREAGCDDYISKPINETEFLKKIKKFV